jgi:hypothetical protein
MILFSWVLILLNIGHFFGDYTHLSKPSMLAAKKFGTPLRPILEHAIVHAVLAFIIAIFMNVLFLKAILIFSIMLVTHFLIDMVKGKLNKEVPILQDPTQYWHWWAFGIDQFLHQVVLIALAQLICM